MVAQIHWIRKSMLKTELLQDVLRLLTVSPLVWPGSVSHYTYKATTHTVVDISSLHIADNIAYLNIFVLS